MGSNVTTGISTIPGRDARDRAIDTMGFGWTYPLRDLPVNAVTNIVPFGCPARIQIQYSQIGHVYQLYSLDPDLPDNDPASIFTIDGEAKVGTGEQIELKSGTIATDRRTYRVHVLETDTELDAWLGNRVTVKQGIDKNIVVELVEDAVGYYEPIEVRLPVPQEGIEYQLVDASLNAWSNKESSELNASIVINSYPLRENITLYVRAKNIDNEVKDILNTPINPRVAPFLDVDAELVEPLVDYAAPATIRLSKVQPGVFYFWRLEAFDEPDCVDPALLIGGDGNHEYVWTRPLPQAVIGVNSDNEIGALNPDDSDHTASSGTDGDQLAIVTGNNPQPDPIDEGYTVDLLLPENFEDATYTLHAIRYFHGVETDESGTVVPPSVPHRSFDQEVLLNPTVHLEVRPQHDLALGWQGPSAGSRQGFVLLANWQCGVEYQLVPHDHLVPIAQTFTTHPSRGISAAEINLDFVVGTPGAGPIKLPTFLLKDLTKYYVKARKIYSNNTGYLGATTNEADRYYRNVNLKPLYFNGTSAYATFPDRLIYDLSDSSYTIEFWMRHWQPLTPDQTLVSIKPADNASELRICLRDKEPAVSFNGSELLLGQVLNFYKWTHLAFRFDKPAAKMAIFLNGEFLAEGKGWDPITTNLEPNRATPDLDFGTVLLGKSTGDDHFRGRLAEFRIWNEARKEYYINHDYNRPQLVPPPGLIGYWPLNDGSGHSLRTGLPGGTPASKVGASWR